MEPMVQVFDGETLVLPVWIQLIRTDWGPALAAEGSFCGFPQKGDTVVFTDYSMPPVIIKAHRCVGEA